MRKTLRQTPFEFTNEVKPVSDPQVTHHELLTELSKVRRHEIVSFVRCFVQERTPAAFSNTPLLWEAIREWIASRLHVHAREIGLSGSAQIGFAIAGDKRGRSFDPKGSDLDLFIVNEALYKKLEAEARLFIIRANNSKTFLDQVSTVERTLSRSYLDLRQIPANHEQYPTVAEGLNDASILIDRLRLHGYQLRPSHFRVYCSWEALASWARLSYGSLHDHQ